MLKNPAVGEALAAVVPAPRRSRWSANGGARALGEQQPVRDGRRASAPAGGGGALRLQKEEEDARRCRGRRCAGCSPRFTRSLDPPAAAADVLPGFLDATAEWEHSVESLVGVVGLMAAVAGTGPEGASQIWSRMQHPLAGRASPGDSFVGALRAAVLLRGAHRRSRGERAIRRGGWRRLRRRRSAGGYGGHGANAGGPNPYAAAFSREREMPEADVQGLRVLGLLAPPRAAPPGRRPRGRSGWRGDTAAPRRADDAALVPGSGRSSRRPSPTPSPRRGAITRRGGRERLEREVAERGAIVFLLNPISPTPLIDPLADGDPPPHPHR